MVIPAWTPLTIYPLGSRVLDPSRFIQQVVGGKSGPSAPAWNDSGGTTNDGSLVWTDKAGTGTWAPNSAVSLGNQILDSDGYIQRVVGGVSGPTAPAWPPLGTTDDGSLEWYGGGSGVGETWAPSVPVSLGRQVYDYCPGASHLQQVVGGRTGFNDPNELPAWNDSGGDSYDGSLVWTDQGPGSGPPAWRRYVYQAIGDEVLDPNGHIQKVTAVNGAMTGAGYITDWNDSLNPWFPNAIYYVSDKILDSNGNLEVCVMTYTDGHWVDDGLGLSGPNQPTWTTTRGWYTFDNGVMWQNLGSPNTPSDRWQANWVVELGYRILDPNGNIQAVNAILSGGNPYWGTTGSVEPDWNTIVGGDTPDYEVQWWNEGPPPPLPTGGTTGEGTVLWQDKGIATSSTWLPSTCYAVRSGVHAVDGSGPDVFVSAISGATTGGTEPVWNDSNYNAFTQDGSVMWLNFGSNEVTWQADHYYFIGQTITDPNGHLQEVTALNNAESGSSEPAWEESYTFDGSILWQGEGPLAFARATQTVLEIPYAPSSRTARGTQLNAQSAIWWNPRTARETQLNTQAAIWWNPRTARGTQYVILLAKALIILSPCEILYPGVVTFSGTGGSMSLDSPVSVNPVQTYCLAFTIDVSDYTPGTDFSVTVVFGDLTETIPGSSISGTRTITLSGAPGVALAPITITVTDSGSSGSGTISNVSLTEGGC